MRYSDMEHEGLRHIFFSFLGITTTENHQYSRVKLAKMEGTNFGSRDKHCRFGTDLILPLLVSQLAMMTMRPHGLLTSKEVTGEGSCTWHLKQASEQYRDFNKAGLSRRA